MLKRQGAQGAISPSMRHFVVQAPFRRSSAISPFRCHSAVQAPFRRSGAPFEGVAPSREWRQTEGWGVAPVCGG
eukprot:COSAG02_NODE_1691_length_11296_cov_7.891757_18_plen_74_part_00